MIAIIDYDAGNTCSVINALERLDVEYVLTDDKAIINAADKVILPGVGHAATAMKVLERKNLVDLIKRLKQPVLGVCLGMQLMCESSEEGETKCLGLFPLEVKKFELENLKVPHMGWNNLQDCKGKLMTGITNEQVYFVHSYYVPTNEYSIANAEYPDSFCAALNKNNFYGVQFHPEKSAKVGERIIKNFLDL